MVTQFGILLVVLAVCSFAPGFFIVRKLRWGPLEKLCGAVGLSLVLIYLAAFAIYLLKLPNWCYWLVTGLCVLAGVLSLRDIARLLRRRQVRRALSGLLFLLVWTVLLLGLVRNYSGGGWVGDWYEHYHRTRFFLDRLPVDTVMFGGYQVPARPPMMNLITAHVLAHQPGDQFPAYQIVSVFLSLLVFLPCCLVAGALVRRGGRGVLILAALFALNPMFVQNATYTWTKLLSGFYVILAIWLYLAGWRKNDSLRTIAAFGCLAAGALVHYSVAPYILLVAIHYTVGVAIRLRAKWKEFAGVAVVSGAMLATWLGWSLAVYGAETTFGSNTAVMAAQKAEGGNIARKADNIFDTFLPHPIRGVPLDLWRQQNKAGYVRDYTFLIYQTNFIAAMGAVGGLAVAWLFAKSIVSRAGPMRNSQRRFWLLLVVFCIIAGIAVVGERERFGVAHICLPPLVFMGVALLAGSFWRLVRPVKWLVVLGCVVDFAVGIMLHFRLQNMTFKIWQDGPRQYATSPEGKVLSNFALGNWVEKTDKGVAFLGDLLAEYSSAIQVIILALFIVVMVMLVLAALNRGPLAAARALAAAGLPRTASAGSGPARGKKRSGSGRTGGRTSRRRPARRGRR